jgi:hypothetical protein
MVQSAASKPLIVCMDKVDLCRLAARVDRAEMIDLQGILALIRR